MNLQSHLGCAEIDTFVENELGSVHLNMLNHKIFIKNVVAVAAYSRLASQSQAKFPLVRPIIHWTSGPPRRYRRRRKKSNCVAVWRLASWSQAVFFWSSRLRVLKPFVYVFAWLREIMAERSRDRPSSTESQPKFPECTHFRRRNDNHRRCQQFRMNDGLPLCTQDSPCLVCQDWLPEAWTTQAKAIAQRNRRKAAATVKAARKETEMLDNSVELHAPRDAFPTKRTKSKDSSKAKRSKTVTSSSQPKSVASSVTAVERPSSHGLDHRRSRTPEPKRRPGEERRHESPRHQSSRRDGSSSDWRESERARPSSSGGSSSGRRAESGSVSKASDTRPSSSSSHHHQHHSSGDRRSLSSSSSRASPDRKSQPSHHERRRESSDRTGGTFVPRRDVQLSPAKPKAPEKRTITVVASPARQIHFESAPAVPVPAPVADGSAGAGPAAGGRLGHEWRPGSAQRHGHRQRPNHRSRLGHRQRLGHRGRLSHRQWPSHRGRLGNRRLGHRWRPCHSGRPDHSCGYRLWQPSRCLGGGVIT